MPELNSADRSVDRHSRPTKWFHHTRRHSQEGSHLTWHLTGIAWFFVALVACLGLCVGLCAAFLPDRQPALLGAAHQMTSAPVTAQDYDGSRAITVTVTVGPKNQTIINTSGIVTEDDSHDGLTSGKVALRVNDQPVIALATAIPLYRDLSVGMRGRDVSAFNTELARLGALHAAPSDTFTAASGEAWSHVLSSVGGAQQTSVHLSDVLWIPRSHVTVGQWQAGVGMHVNSGSSIGEVPGSIISMDARGLESSDQPRVLRVFGQKLTLPPGISHISSAPQAQDFYRRVSSTSDFQSQSEEALKAGLDGSLAFASPLRVLSVPSAAVISVRGSQGCIVSEGKAFPVSIVGSEPGVSLVHVLRGSVPSSVDVGSSIEAVRCK